MLRQMGQARRFNGWMAKTIRPFIGRNVLEIGAGRGNMTELLTAPGTQYLATDTNQEHLRELCVWLENRPDLRTALCDAADSNDFLALESDFDTVICLNVLEHIEDDSTALANIHGCLRSGGKAIVLVPQGAAAFGSLDEVLHHKRRYSEAELRKKMTAAGFHVERVLRFNRATYPGWIWNARVLRRKTLSSMQLRIFDFLVPVWRRVDSWLPWPPTSLIGIGVKEPL